METKQSKTLKALNRLGKEATIKRIAGLINNTKQKTKYILHQLHKKGLVKRRVAYQREFGKTFPIAYYSINKKNKNVAYWVKHY